MVEPALVQRLRQASRRTVRGLGLLSGTMMETRCTAAQCHSLLALAEEGTLRVGELSDRLGLDKSTVSRAVQPLQARKLVEVSRSGQDQRSKPLRLTEAGRELVARINAAADAQVHDALDLLSETEKDTVVRGMELYAGALRRSARTRGLTLRPIRESDDPALAEIIQTVMTEFGAVGAGYSIEDAEVHAMSKAYGHPRSAYFVAEREGRILGGAGVAPLVGGDPHVCELKKMYVLTEGRGLGVGRRLLDLCLDAARAEGFTLCYLETLTHMTQARHLYEKAGFRPIDHALGNTGHHGCNSWYTLELSG